MVAIFKKEFKAYFCNPIGYITLALFFLVNGLFFIGAFGSGNAEAASLSLVSSILLLLIIIPMLTMRMISEDRRQKVDQVLFTAPVSLTKIVLGKFLSAVAMFGMCNILFIVFEIIVSTYIAVNWLAFINTLFGFMLMGSALIAIGMFISSLSESPTVCFLFTFAVSLLLLYIEGFAGIIGVDALAKASVYFSFVSRFENFTSSIFSISDTLYFLSIIALFVFLTIRSLEKKRWS